MGPTLLTSLTLVNMINKGRSNILGFVNQSKSKSPFSEEARNLRGLNSKE